MGHDGYGVVSSNWTDSEEYCKAQNAHLVSIRSYDELKFISSLISMASYNTWTGLYSNDNEKTWKWTDETFVDYLPWGSMRLWLHTSSCVVVWAEFIYDDYCPTIYRTLCKKPAFP